MIVCEDKQILYFHNPKTAGSSITYALAPHCTYKHNLNGLVMNDGWQGMFHHDGYMHRVMSHIDYTMFNHYFKFSFVRNPFDLVASYWEKSRHELGSLEEFLQSEHFPGNNSLKFLQTEFLDVNALDYVGRYENLNVDWSYIAKRFGLYETLPQINAREHKMFTDYRPHYTTEARKIVEERYKKDLEKLDYDF